MTVSIFFYALYIRQQIYYEGTRAMLETYEQVNKTFTMFAQRNWNVLADWGGYLREMAAPETATQWRDFKEEKKTWNYSDFYMANENGDYWTVDGREGLGSENIQAVFTALQVAGEPIVSSYTATSGIRKVVFAVPVDPITMNGVTYTSLAVSYDNDTIEAGPTAAGATATSSTPTAISCSRKSPRVRSRPGWKTCLIIWKPTQR